MRSEQLEYAYTRYGTPLYIFNLDILAAETKRIRGRLSSGTGLCYAMKANPFLTETMAGLTDRIEVCSMGEFRICRELGIPSEKLFISGVLKKKSDIPEILDYCRDKSAYTVESAKQFHYFAEWSDAHSVSLRLYPRLTSGNQFGVSENALENMIRVGNMSPYLKIEGIHYFSGTQKKNPEQFERELNYLDGFLLRLEKDYQFHAEHLEYGPGTAVPYFRGKEAPAYTDEGLERLAGAIENMRWKGHVTIELGRALAASCGFYLTEIADVKQNGSTNYCIVDGGNHQMNYDGQIRGMYEPCVRLLPEGIPGPEKKWTVCGALCTVNDVLCHDISLQGVKTGRVLAFERTGAYSCMEGMSLFLSHALPLAVTYDSVRGWRQVRERIDTYQFNMCRKGEDKNGKTDEYFK